MHNGGLNESELSASKEKKKIQRGREVRVERRTRNIASPCRLTEAKNADFLGSYGGENQLSHLLF